jgi:hypothetical protein
MPQLLMEPPPPDPKQTPFEYDVNREFILAEIDRYFAGEIDAELLLAAIKICKPVTEGDQP